MKYLGDYAEDYATLNFKFSTHKADGTPITLGGTPAVSVYKANGTTQSVAGVTLSVDFDSVTGLHNVLIDLSADAFYAAGNDYAVVITTGTVDSVSVVGTVLAHFSINNRTAAAIKTDTAAILADTGTDGVVLAADAITAAKIADDAFSNEHFATGAITADAIADNAIDAGAIAADAITAAKIAAGAIDAATFAADVDAEVASYVWDALRASHTVSDSFGEIDTTADVADAVWDEALSGHTTTGTAGKGLADAAIGGDPWDEALPGSYGAGTAGKILSDILADTGTDGVVLGADAITSAKIADDALGSEHFADSFYAQLGIVAYGTAQSATGTTLVLAAASTFADDELNGSVVVITGGTGVGQSRVITDYVSSTDTATVDTWTTTPSGTITYVVFAAAPASATAVTPVNVVQISGDSTAADNAESFFDGTGYAGTNNVIPTVTTVASVAGIGSGGIASTSFQSGAITATAIATGAIDADALATDAVAEIADGVWDEAISGHAGAGSTGKAVTDVLADTGTDGVVVGSIAANAINAAAIATGAIDADALATDAVNEIVDQVWDETLGDHVGSGTTGAGLTAAGSAGDPWSTSVPGAYGAGTAGYLIGTHINAPIGTVDTVVDAIKVKTDYLPSAAAGTAGGVFIAGANAATSVSTALTANITGNLSGSVGSVTGAIGSVALKKNTALAKFPFVMRDTVNHAPATGLTVTAVRSIDGAAFGAGSLSAVTELGSGVYTVDFAGADLNGATVLLKCTAAGADDLLLTILTNP